MKEQLPTIVIQVDRGAENCQTQPITILAHYPSQDMGMGLSSRFDEGHFFWSGLGILVISVSEMDAESERAIMKYREQQMKIISERKEMRSQN